MKKNAPEITVGTILKHSIGCGHDSFYQVIDRHNNTLRVQRLESKPINVNVRCQTCDYVPYKGKFCVGGQHDLVTLRLKMDQRGQVQIGPIKRLNWWSVWDGEPKGQWSS